MPGDRDKNGSVARAREFTKVQELVYEMKVEQVMTTDVITVRPDNLMSELRELLRDKRISGVPVMEGGRLVGMVSIEDFIKCLSEGKMDSQVRERMCCDIQILYSNDPLVRAVEEFDRLGYGRFPVLDRQSGTLVGIVSKGDIVRGLLKKLEVDYHEEEIHRYRASHFFEDIIADRTTLIFQYKVTGKDFDHAGEASSDLRRSLRRMGMPPDAVRRLAIAAYEAEMNIVVFTEGGEITAQVTPQAVRVEAVDSGPGIADIERAMQPGYSTAPEWVREFGFGAGMGLPNIQKSSDEMRIESTAGKGTRLEFVVYFNRDADDDREGNS